MRPILKKMLDLPEIARRQAPVIRIQNSKIDHAITFDPPRMIHVTFRVAQRERTRSCEHRLPAVKARIARACNRAPSRFRAIHENHMIEKVDRLESKYERRISVLLECNRREHCGLETMRGTRAHYTTKPAHGVAGSLSIVWKPVQPFLHEPGSSERVYDATLSRR